MIQTVLAEHSVDKFVMRRRALRPVAEISFPKLYVSTEPREDPLRGYIKLSRDRELKPKVKP